MKVMEPYASYMLSFVVLIMIAVTFLSVLNLGSQNTKGLLVLIFVLHTVIHIDRNLKTN